MLYDQLWEIVILAVGASVAAAVPLRGAIRIIKSVRRIEAELNKMEKKINILRLEESRRLMMELKANSGAEIERTVVWPQPDSDPVRPDDAARIVAKFQPCLSPQDEDALRAPAHCNGEDH
jgi:hypothetical protein